MRTLRRRRPYDRPYVGDPITVTQPPEKFGHLTGEDLYEALTADPEVWDQARFAAEAGRSVASVRRWTHRRYKVDAWSHKQAGHPDYQGDEITEVLVSDRTAPPPDGYHSDSPVWEAGLLREWMIQVGVMDRTGRFKPHEPGGRHRDSPDIGPRARRRSIVREAGPQVLLRYRHLRDQNETQAQALAVIADENGWSVTQVKKRIEAGRAIESGRIT